MNKEAGKRQKFTTTLDKATLKQLEEIKIEMNYNQNKHIKGLNEVIEIITRERWEQLNDNNNKTK